MRIEEWKGGGVSATLMAMPPGNLLSYADLEARWQARGDTPAARRRWVREKAHRWKLVPLKGTRGDDARFRPLDVINAEARAAGERVRA